MWVWVWTVTWPSTVSAHLGTMFRADIINFWVLRYIVLALTGAPAIQIDRPTLYIVTARFSCSAYAWHGHIVDYISYGQVLP